MVSYRLPFRLSVAEGKLKIIPSAGGLATALHSYFRNEKKEKGIFETFHWVGVSDITKRAFEQVSVESAITDDDLTLHPVFVDRKDSDHFYNGFCNSVLWPLFHYFPSYVIYDQQFFEAYRRANETMCRKILELYTPGDVVWIHDYHFMLLPAMLKSVVRNATVGFFLHIPFPAFELFRILPKPWRMGILSGLVEADLVGFQTEFYASHFRESVERMLGCKFSDDGILVRKTTMTTVKGFPISIDFSRFQGISLLPAVKREVKKIKGRFPGSKLILSVDRLDYTKAIINRLESFELFLHKNPRYIGKVNYLLLLVPSRDTVLKYKENKKEVEMLISRINGMHSSMMWTPIIYQYRSVDQKKLVAMYSASDIALITPVRDGMNLVAKEYIASRPDNDGVLILSETTGSAEELAGAILVNPNDRHEVAGSILQALNQTTQEQKERITGMKEHIKNNSVRHWVDGFIGALVHEVPEDIISE